MNTPAALQSLAEARIEQFRQSNPSSPLTAPITYLMGIGGKRMRPVLTLMGAELFGAKAEDALEAALAIEVFHNFTLMHDDIMDQAPLRRGQVTVHRKWNVNTAILSGDAMMIQAYDLLAHSPAGDPAELLRRFNRSAFDVCAGQQLDMDFEQRDDVTVPEYIEMIRLKTAVLLGCALELGAMVAGADRESSSLLSAFGENLGISFQLRDDYLDAFGDPSKFGKQVGGDILADKKTFLLIRAMEKAHGDHRETLSIHMGPAHNADQKVQAIRSVMTDLGVDAELLSLSSDYYQRALEHLEAIPVEGFRKESLRALAATLMDRES